MRPRNWMIVLFAAGALVLTAQKSSRFGAAVGYRDTPVLPGQKWKVHDIDRPHPKMVTPGAKLGDAPSDAIVLFDGKDLSAWQVMDKKTKKLGPASWKVGNGYFEVTPGKGDLVSNEKFGDAQYHVEWSAPTELSGDSQWRANSGFIIMSRYEIQVLDCWNNLTYADGQAASIYGQWPPLANACRKPGEWQAYDIVWEAPKFEGDKLVKPAYATVFHNGVLMHHRQEVIGRMAHRVVGTYAPHSAAEPLTLQDHDVPVRYRNIWVRRIKGYDQP